MVAVGVKKREGKSPGVVEDTGLASDSQAGSRAGVT